MTERRAGDQQNIKDIRIAFHETRILGEELVRDHKISWEAFSIFMIAFEEKLKALGDHL